MDVRFEIGPTDAEVARLWLSSSQAILRAIRHRPWGLSFVVSEPLLDLADMYVSIWLGVAVREDVFHWTSVVDAQVVLDLAEQWRSIAGLSDAHMAALGSAWPSEESRAFYDALLAGVVQALHQDVDTVGIARDIVERPPGAVG